MDKTFHPEEPVSATGHACSWYEATAKGLVQFPALTDHVQADVCVIGGGLTGLSTALHLAERGVDTVLLEARRVGWGASGRNGGQFLTGQRLDPSEMEEAFGPDMSHALWDLAIEAKAAVRERITRHAIDCDLRPGALYAAAKPADYGHLRDEAELIATAYAYPHITVVPPEEMADYVGTECYHGGLWDREAGHLHPLNYALGLARAARDAGVRVFEMSPALELPAEGPIRIRTPEGHVSADHVVIACNGYHGGIVPALDRVMLPVNSFVGVTPPLAPEVAARLLPQGGCVADTRMVLDYYRLTPDNRLLFGGGESYGHALPRPEAINRILGRAIARVFPDLDDVGRDGGKSKGVGRNGVDLDYVWGGRIAITWRRMPHIGPVGSGRTAAHGFSGQGLALTTQAGAVIAEMLTGDPARFDLYKKVRPLPFPGGRLLRRPLTVLGLLWATLRDRL